MEQDGSSFTDLLLSINSVEMVGRSMVANSIPQSLVAESYEAGGEGSLAVKSSLAGSSEWDYHLERENAELDDAEENVNQCSHDNESGNIFGDDIPKLGKIFSAEEEAYSLYNAYAFKVGFSIRKGWVKRNKDGVVTCRRFCCSKEGKRVQDRRYENLKIYRPETRTGCLAHMTILREDSGRFTVSSFKGQHNHELAHTENVHMLRSHRKISAAQATQVDLAYEAGLTPTEIYGFHGIILQKYTEMASFCRNLQKWHHSAHFCRFLV